MIRVCFWNFGRARGKTIKFSAEYELPIRPSTSSFQSSSNHNNHQNNQGSPFFASQIRRGNNSALAQQQQQQQAVAFQNNAYLVDEGGSTEGIQKQIWDNQNLRQLNNNVNGNDFITGRNPPNTNEEQQRFGGSSRVSRV